MTRHKNNPTYNVKHPSYKKIQDMAYHSEQSVFRGYSGDAINRLDIIIWECEELKKELKEGPIKNGD